MWPFVRLDPNSEKICHDLHFYETSKSSLTCTLLADFLLVSIETNCVSALIKSNFRNFKLNNTWIQGDSANV